MIMKPIKYSIFWFDSYALHDRYCSQQIYEIIALAIPIHNSIKGISCAMPGYIAIMADSCTVLTSFGPITLGL